MVKAKLSEKDLVGLLTSMGYKVKKDDELVRHTFVLPVVLLDRFMAKVRTDNLKIQDAVREAFEDWLTK